MFFGILVLCISWLVIHRRELADQDLACHLDYEYEMVRRCRPACLHGHFSLVGMTECVPWLTCRDLGEIHVQERIGGGAVKQVTRRLHVGQKVELLSVSVLLCLP